MNTGSSDNDSQDLERRFALPEAGMIESFYRTERISFGQQQLRDALGSLTQQHLLESALLEGDAEQLRYHMPIGLMRIWISQESPPSTFRHSARGQQQRY